MNKQCRMNINREEIQSTTCNACFSVSQGIYTRKGLLLLHFYFVKNFLLKCRFFLYKNLSDITTKFPKFPQCF